MTTIETTTPTNNAEETITMDNVVTPPPIHIDGKKSVYQTVAIRAVVDLVRATQRQMDARIGQVYGQPGTGKTTITHYLVQILGGYRLCGLDTGKRDHLFRLALQMGYTGPTTASYASLLSFLEKRVNRDTLILLDEADNVTWRHLEPLRYLSDEFGAVVILFGSDILAKNFSDARSGAYLARLSSRIGTKLLHLKPLSKSGIEKYILVPNNVGITGTGKTKVDKAISTKWFNYTKGNWRLGQDLVLAYEDCRQLRVSGHPDYKDHTDAELVDIAARTLHGRTTD